MDLERLKDIAIEAALAAGSIIRDSINHNVEVETKNAGNQLASQVVTEVDRRCEKVILDHLQDSLSLYNLGLLTEESEDDGSRFKKDFFWCIDPLDGTLPFVKKEKGFSVSIALINRDGISVIGIVYDPTADTMYHALKGQGAYKNYQPWIIDEAKDLLTYVTDKKLEHTPHSNLIEKWLNEEAQRLGLKGLKIIEGGGAVLNAIWALENSPACMLKLPKAEEGGGSIWDFAATACIYHEFNFTATSYRRKRLNLNPKETTFMNKEGILLTTFPVVKLPV